MRRVLIGTFIAAAIGLTITGPVGGRSASASPDPSAGWLVGCGFSHRAPDDPIVSPGMTGMGHSHDFFGNETTDRDSTVDSLLGQATSCSLGDDAAAYWAPTLYVNGEPVTPAKASIYYRTQVDGSTVQPFPSGLKMIAGDPHAMSPQPVDIVYYNCHSGPDQHHDAAPYDCGSSNVDAHVRFPQCWDGVNLDSADHKSHMAYPSASHGVRTCPSSHPVVLPRLIIRISWPISNGNGVTLASGPAYTLHADFFNAWNATRLAKLVHDCLNAGIDCGKQIGSATSPPSPSPSPSPSPLNLVENPGFEAGTSGWRSSRKAQLDVGAGGRTGDAAARLRSVGHRDARCAITDMPNAVPTTHAGRYTASVWVRAPQRGGRARLLLVERDSAGDRVAVSASDVALTRGWREIAVRLEPRDPGLTSLSLLLIRRHAGRGTCFIADDAGIVLRAA